MRDQLWTIVTLVITFLLLSVPSAFAIYSADFTYDITQSGTTYTYTFNIENTSTDSSTANLDFFMLDLDADGLEKYSNVAWSNTNFWWENAYEYDPSFGGLPAGVDADDSLPFGGSGGIAQGDSLSGFQFSFDYTGVLTAADQVFSWTADFGTSDTDNGGIDMGGYWVAEEIFGPTTYSPASTPAPEPGTFLLLGLGLLGFAGKSCRKKTRC